MEAAKPSSRDRVARALDGYRSHIALACIALGLALGPAAPWLAVAAAAVPAAGAAWARRVARGFLLGALLLAASWVGQERAEALRPPPGPTPSGPFSALAQVRDAPRVTVRGWRVELASGRGGSLRLAAEGPPGTHPPPLATGDIVRVRATVRPLGRPASGYAAWLRRRGVAAELDIQAIRRTGRTRGGLRGALDEVRRRAARGLEQGMSARNGVLAKGIVLGQDGGIDPALRDDFRRSGLGHVLAVSGQNVALLCALALPLLIAVGLGIPARVVVLLALVAAYVPVAGGAPSLQRAGIAAAAALVALLAGRHGSAVHALLLAATGTLALDPFATADIGWQLSFAAVAGILVARPRGAGPSADTPRRIVGAIRQAAAMTAAATLATAPLAAHHFGRLSLTAVVANVLALPAVAPIMWLGTVQALLGQAASSARPGQTALGLAAAVGHATGAFTAYLATLARTLAAVPGADTAIGLASWASVGAAYAALVGGLLAARWLWRAKRHLAAPAAASWRRMPAEGRAAALVALLAAVALGAVRLLAVPPPPDQLTVSFLDVGQGDATLVQDGRGAAVLFDAGPAEARVVRRLRAAGVRRLQAVVATHPSADHHGGLKEVFETYPVDLVVDGGDGTSDPAFRSAIATARRRGARVVRGRQGLSWSAGGLHVSVLSPPPRPPGPPPEDPNPRGLVTLVRSGGFSLFLSADAESPALLPLDLPDVEAMKAPHHGSRDAGLPELLERLRPEFAAIEVGEGNTYGHPAPETLDALRRRVPQVHRTYRDGTIRLSLDGGGAMRVATER